MGGKWADWVSRSHTRRASPGGCFCLLTTVTLLLMKKMERDKGLNSNRNNAATPEKEEKYISSMTLRGAIRTVWAQGSCQGQANEQEACL